MDTIWSRIQHNLIIPAAELVGRIPVLWDKIRGVPEQDRRDVEKRTDLYKNFYATKVELLSLASLPRSLRRKVIFDPHFNDAIYLYKLTAVRLTKNGKLEERSFIAKESDFTAFVPTPSFNKIEISINEVKIGDGTTLIGSKTALEIGTHGQYLEPLAPVIPRAQHIKAEATQGTDIQKIETALTQSKVKRGFVWHFQKLER